MTGSAVTHKYAANSSLKWLETLASSISTIWDFLRRAGEAADGI